MTEIKFRCIHKIGGKMEYGYEPLRLLYNEASGSTLSNTKAHNIMQFTRLRDKNGKEIYDGDIIRHIDFEWKAKVAWSENGQWILVYEGTGRTVLLSDRIDYIEVIGNIYENPELLSLIYC